MLKNVKNVLVVAVLAVTAVSCNPFATRMEDGMYESVNIEFEDNADLTSIQKKDLLKGLRSAAISSLRNPTTFKPVSITVYKDRDTTNIYTHSVYFEYYGSNAYGTPGEFTLVADLNEEVFSTKIVQSFLGR